MNRKDVFHLYYLISNGIRKGEKYSGLAHVAEHTCLIPAYKENNYIGSGYTCIDHACIYFTSNSLATLKKIDEDFGMGAYITEENVRIAKHQVKYEIMNLFQDTQEKEKLVAFVTQNRIKKFPMGDMAEIEKITTIDVNNWFLGNKQRGDIYRFLFRDAKDIEISNLGNNVHCYSSQSFDNEKIGLDEFYYTNMTSKKKKAELYFKIPIFYEKIEFVKKALFEYCIQKKVLEAVGVKIYISEKYYDYNERFNVISFIIDSVNDLDNKLREMRKEISNITLKEFEHYKAEFKESVSQIVKVDESNLERINSVKNLILYDKPIINTEDLIMIDAINYNTFPIKDIVNTSLRIVIR